MDYKIGKRDAERLHEFLNDNVQRNFDTPDDQHAVFKKLVEVGRLHGFLYKVKVPLCCNEYDENFIEDLFINPERFNKLVSLYLEEKS